MLTLPVLSFANNKTNQRMLTTNPKRFFELTKLQPMVDLGQLGTIDGSGLSLSLVATRWGTNLRLDVICGRPTPRYQRVDAVE